MYKNLITRENPFLDLAKKFFDNDFEYFTTSKNIGLSNVSQDENEYLIEVSAPGLKKEDIKIGIENNILKISSNIEDKKEVETKNYHSQEFYKSSFERSFTIPKGTNKEEISATMTDGILVVKIPKVKEEKNENIQITIK